MTENNFVLNLDETIEGFNAKDIELSAFIIPDTLKIRTYRENYISYDICVNLELTTKDERYPCWKYSTWIIYRHIYEYKDGESHYAEYLLKFNDNGETCALNKIIFAAEDYLYFIMAIARGSVSDMLKYMSSLDIHPESIKYLLKKEKIAEKKDK